MTDIVPGIVAAVVFLVLLALLSSSGLMLSVVLAVVAYFGVKLVLPSQSKSAKPTETGRAVLLRLMPMIQTVQDRSIRQKLEAIARQADALLLYGEAHPKRASAGESLVRNYLQTTCESVERYQEKTRFGQTDGGQRGREKMEELLESVHAALTGFLHKLTTEDDTTLAQELEVVNQTLKELNKVYLEEDETTLYGRWDVSQAETKAEESQPLNQEGKKE